MAEVVVFHHVHGLTRGVMAFAQTLRDAGHAVHAPDLFEGRAFATLDEGLDYVRSVGFAEIIARGVAAAENVPATAVYAGFSLGVLPAQYLVQTRQGARGAVLMHACAPVQEFGDRWPPEVPVQIHAMNADRSFVDEGDLDAARDVLSQADDGELFLYPGSEHLFADPSLPGYDEAAAEALQSRVLDFLRCAG
ncbi:dienelactone hydrolase [Aeromicrobium phragmitis]|uniref:Dienelactone hydrolase n=1 Tax=Aeromicrobium phragmitis TaxID=2478914 RepID=A0A3L8PLI2_9ACTN|nr:dienelactone hydrolase family protein [Aeromicrobium phragmitis]RLV56266.1 dienelactone hydrolase [Aeromicrobium phragmitis]